MLKVPQFPLHVAPGYEFPHGPEQAEGCWSRSLPGSLCLREHQRLRLGFKDKSKMSVLHRNQLLSLVELTVSAEGWEEGTEEANQIVLVETQLVCGATSCIGQAETKREECTVSIISRLPFL